MSNDLLKQLEAYRKDISKIDERIYALIKKREHASAKIGKIKRTLNLKDRDIKRERNVLDLAHSLAQKLNLPVDVVTKLQSLLIAISLSRQEQDRIKYSKKASPLHIAIVGGAGRLGSWFYRFFRSHKHNVVVIDKKSPPFSCKHIKELNNNLEKYDVIALATPIRSTAMLLNSDIFASLKHPVVFDVASVKNPLKKALDKLKNNGVKITSTHPMFGPDIDMFFGKHLIRTSLGIIEADNMIDSLFYETSIRIIDMSFSEHDELVSYLLSLSHILNICFIACLRESKYNIAMLNKLSSPTFSHLLASAEKVYNENPKLYYEIQALNPKNKNLFSQLKNSLEKIISASEHKTDSDFVDIIQQGKKYISNKQ